MSTTNNFKKTKKNISNNSFSINRYSNTFKNTEMLPNSPFIEYLFNNYKKFANYDIICAGVNTNPLILQDLFNFKPNDFPHNLKKNTININTLHIVSLMPLDQLISYFIYLTDSTIFYYNYNLFISSIKNQIGKDIRRGVFTINNKTYKYNTEEYINMKNYQITDLLYQNIIDHLIKIGNKKIININIVNKVSLLCSQNVFNAINNLIIVRLNELLNPEIIYLTKVNKYYDIFISKKEISILISFKCSLLITQDLNTVNVEYPCGNVEFIINFDFRKNTYNLKKFIIDYDINKCGPNKPSTNDLVEPKINNKYALVTTAGLTAAGLTTAGILLAPFILGGTKNKTQKLRK